MKRQEQRATLVKRCEARKEAIKSLKDDRMTLMEGLTTNEKMIMRSVVLIDNKIEQIELEDDLEVLNEFVAYVTELIDETINTRTFSPQLMTSVSNAIDLIGDTIKKLESNLASKLSELKNETSN
jgi:translation initiation factor 2 gamma subunit (eIF-2gamma)